ncbi:hypothetical protein AVEN_37511-1, partial [Araneus ventricosus]
GPKIFSAWNPNKLNTPLTPRAWARAYLPLQYFNLDNEEPVYQVSSKLD